MTPRRRLGPVISLAYDAVTAAGLRGDEGAALAAWMVRVWELELEARA
jgi:hypothetical protein